MTSEIVVGETELVGELIGKPLEYKQVIAIRSDLNMRKGKIGAQVAHASMKFLLDDVPFIKGRLLTKELNEEEFGWLTGSFAKIVVYVSSEQELLDLITAGKAAGLTVHSITDSGRTEFNGVPTLTCAAFGPHEVSKFDVITGHLKLM